VQLVGETVPCLLERSPRRTIGLIISPEGLVVRAPLRASLKAIESVVQEKATWITKKLQQVFERAQQQSQSVLRWSDGAELPYWGQALRLEVQASEHRSIRPGARLLLTQNDAGNEPVVLQVVQRTNLQDETRKLVWHWWQSQALQHFRQRLDHFAALVQVRWTQLALSNAATRWGSAKSDGSIRLNWRLMHFAPDLADYVVVHELCHLREMNHSPRFWREVERVMPDYAQRQAALKQAVVPRWTP
jgi:hypothetical protein